MQPIAAAVPQTPVDAYIHRQLKLEEAKHAIALLCMSIVEDPQENVRNNCLSAMTVFNRDDSQYPV